MADRTDDDAAAARAVAAGRAAAARAMLVAESVTASSPRERRIVGILGTLAGFLSVLMPIMWLVTGLGEFWPVWVWFGFACAFGPYWIWQRVRAVPASQGGYRLYVAQAGLSIYVAVIVLVVWLLSGLGSFWPAWPLAAIAFLQLLHFLIGEHHLVGPDAALTERVDELTRSRSGALDVLAAELRRIERDLHDGAQARLVALTMQLGRAEQRLGDDVDPATRALITGAQEEARLAIAELRDLARGIAPPVLADRGLAAAVEALAKRSPLEVEVASQIALRPAPVVESAAYFVIAEALTNAAKHSPGASVRVTLVGTDDRLQLVVADDGIGGADPHGGGLTGLAQRAQALDGTLTVVSPVGHGTTITAELPCGS
ncbi:MAG: sensor histidine kinase [Solirubrobacteraceae bacterium]